MEGGHVKEQRDMRPGCALEMHSIIRTTTLGISQAPFSARQPLSTLATSAAS